MSTPRTLTLTVTVMLLASFGFAFGAAQDGFDGLDGAVTDDRDRRLEQQAEPAPSLRVDPQVSDGSMVTISRANLNTTAWLVIHADQNGSPGEVLGNSTLLQEGLTVGIDVAVNLTADQNETVTLHAMLHHDDGNETYDFPDGDPPMRNRTGDVVVHAFEVRIGQDQVVVATGPARLERGEDGAGGILDNGQGDDQGTLEVALVRLDQSGYIVLHRDTGGQAGEVVGKSEFLSPGEHRNVTVQVNATLPLFGDQPGQTPTQSPGQSPTQSPGQSPTQSPGQSPTQSPGQSPTQTPGQTATQTPGQTNQQGPQDQGDQTSEDRRNVTLWAMVHIDDGNEEYEFPGPDVPVTVGTTPVMTPFSVIPAEQRTQDDDDDQDVGEDVPEDDEDGEADTPGVSVAALLAAVVVMMVLVRRHRRGAS